MSGVQTLTVEPGEGDQRVDRWLRRRFPHVAQGRIEKMCRKGELRVDGGRVKANTRLEEGQAKRCRKVDISKSGTGPTNQVFRYNKKGS